VFVEGPGTDGERKENMRSKPLSGKLLVSIKGARELDHAPVVTTSKSRSASRQSNETSISIKVEGTQRARSHPSRTDRWNEDFEIIVDKANEVEIAVFDKQPGEAHPILIGLLWIRISDLVEALRRQKVTMETEQGGWLPAEAMGDPSTANPGFYPSQMNYGDMNVPVSFGSGAGGMTGGAANTSGQAEGVDGWFSVEPAGALALHLNFGSFPRYLCVGPLFFFKRCLFL
jgi:hypothetical protein